MNTKQIGFVAGGVLVGVAAFLIFSGALRGGNEYTCADGTAFRLSVKSDRSSATVHPTANASVFTVRTLERVEGEVGTTFVGGTVVLFGKGTDLQLITTSTSTVCKPSGDQEPINWGE